MSFVEKIPIIGGLFKPGYPITVRIKEQRGGADRISWDRAKILTQGKRVYVFDLQRRKEVITATYDVIILDTLGKQHLDLYSPAPGIYYPVTHMSSSVAEIDIKREEAINLGFGEILVPVLVPFSEVKETYKLTKEQKDKIKTDKIKEDDFPVAVKKKIKELPDETIVPLRLPLAKAMPRISEEAKISYQESLKRKAELYNRKSWLDKYGPQMFFIIAMGILMVVFLRGFSTMKEFVPIFKELSSFLQEMKPFFMKWLAEQGSGVIVPPTG